MKKEKNNLKKINIFCFIICFVSLIFIFCAKFINYKFGSISFEQLLYSITKTEGANFSIVFSAIFYILIRIIIVLSLVVLIYKFYKYLKIKIIINVGVKKHILKLEIFKYNRIITTILSLLLLFGSSYYSFILLNIDDYIKS